ncbi:MAG: NAD(P)H-binding protein [Pseudomonadales bacterium]|nr:NAD(P)H-binding protein [Pseudomonadales bacterium]
MALAGASGHIGQEVLRALAMRHDVVALTRSPARARVGDPELPVRWRHCDFLARSDLAAALTGVRFLVYLVHARLPSARLDQLRSDDLDLLLADTFAGAAAHHGVEQIVCLQGPRRCDGSRSADRGPRGDVVEALAAHGVPVTVLHAGLIVAPGGTMLRLLRDTVVRLPLVPVPGWASHRRQPIAATDVARAVDYCLGNTATHHGRFSIGGPELMDVPQLLSRVAEAFGRRPRIVTLRSLPAPLYAIALRCVSPASHPALVRAFVDDLSCDSIADDNPVQRFLQQPPATPLRDALGAGATAPVRDREALRRTLRREDDAWLRKARTVRSIQRYRCPPDRNARWLAETYFRWLSRLLRPFVVCETDPDEGSVSIMLRFPRLRLLELSLAPDHSGPDRRLYFITGGVLAARRPGSRGRMEFRDVAHGRYTIVAIHDYEPLLPWNLYHLTQAVAHGLVMRAFRRRVEGRRAAELES